MCDGSFLEIYQEEIRDLLAQDPKQKRDLKEDPNRGVIVKDLTDNVVQDEASLLKVMERGIAHRTVGATLMNEVCSIGPVSCIFALGEVRTHCFDCSYMIPPCTCRVLHDHIQFSPLPLKQVDRLKKDKIASRWANSIWWI